MVVKELNTKIKVQNETIAKQNERIQKLKFDKGIGPQVDSMI
jgi:hypothetical protein